MLQNSLEVEIAVGLLIAVAIIATLLSVTFETKFHSRWAAYATILFGVSGILSVVILADLLVFQVTGYLSILTYFTPFVLLSAIFAFLVASEILVYIAFRSFWKKGKVTRR